MMRDLYLGVQLPFDSEIEREHSEDVLIWLHGAICRHNLLYLLRHPETPPLYSTPVRYAPPDQLSRPPLDRNKLKMVHDLLCSMELEPETIVQVLRIIRGAEVLLDIPSLYRRGKGDCNELVPIRIAELWRTGVYATPFLTKQPNDHGGWTYHAIVQWPDGSAEDPSLILGMGGAARADERREEIRKNQERWLTYLTAAKHMVDAGMASPAALGQHIDRMGIVPRQGVFPTVLGRQLGRLGGVRSGGIYRAA